MVSLWKTSCLIHKTILKTYLFPFILLGDFVNDWGWLLLLENINSLHNSVKLAFISCITDPSKFFVTHFWQKGICLLLFLKVVKLGPAWPVQSKKIGNRPWGQSGHALKLRLQLTQLRTRWPGTFNWELVKSACSNES